MIIGNEDNILNNFPTCKQFSEQSLTRDCVQSSQKGHFQVKQIRVNLTFFLPFVSTPHLCAPVVVCKHCSCMLLCIACVNCWQINLCSVHQREGEKNTIASYVSSALFNFGALLFEMITAVFVDDIEMREGQSGYEQLGLCCLLSYTKQIVARHLISLLLCQGSCFLQRWLCHLQEASLSTQQKAKRERYSQWA